MSYDYLIVFLVVISNLCLAFILYFKSPRRLANRAFFLFLVCIVVWVISNSLENEPLLAKYAELLLRIDFVVAPWIFYFFAVFCLDFPEPFARLSMSRLVLLSVPITVMSISSFSNMVINNIGLHNEVVRFEPGRLYVLYSVTIFGYAIVACSIQILKYVRFRGIKRAQILYVLVGFSVSAFIATITNLIMPLVLGPSISLARLGISGVLVLTTLTSYAIVKYRLMDVTVIIRKSLVYTISISVLLAVAIALVIGLPKAFPDMPEHRAVAISVLAILLALLALGPLVRSIREIAETILLKDQQRHREALRTFSRAATRLSSLDKLADLIVSTVVEATQVKKTALWLLGRTPREYRPRASRGLGGISREAERGRLTSRSKIIGHLRRVREVVIREELERILPSEEFQGLNEDFQRLEAEVCVPILDGRKLIGLITLSSKPRGIYSDEDVEWLTTLANQSAVALQNAQLHQEVVWMKEYNESILENMESGMITVDPEGKIAVFNPAAERLTGLSAGDVVGKRVHVLGPDLSEPLTAALNGGKLSSHLERTLSVPGASPIPLIFSTSLLHDRRNEKSGAVMVFSDLSQVKELEEEKDRAQRLASVGELAADLAHEIKNPLVSIRTFTELLPERFSDEAFREHFLEVAGGEIARIDSLVTQLCQLARRPSSRLEAVDLRLLLEETLSLLSAQMEGQGVQVLRRYSDSMPPLRGDGGELRQVFLNVLKNSLEAMPEGGMLRVDTLCGEDGGGKRCSEVRISDTGVGIPQEYAGRIFDPFFTTKEKGTGLGLTICHRLIESYGGDLRVENNPESPGVIVTLRFPIQEEHVP